MDNIPMMASSLARAYNEMGQRVKANDNNIKNNIKLQQPSEDERETNCAASAAAANITLDFNER